MRNLCWLFIVVLILSTASVLSEVEVTVNPLDDSILMYGEASFEVTLKNLKGSEDSFEVFTRDTNWIIRRDPLFSVLGPHESKTFTMYFIPSSQAGPGPKGVDITFKTTSDDVSTTKQFYIYVSPSTSNINFNPSAKILTKIENDG